MRMEVLFDLFDTRNAVDGCACNTNKELFVHRSLPCPLRVRERMLPSAIIDRMDIISG